MASLGELYNMRSDAYSELATQRRKLIKYEDAYDSLVSFKGTVSQSHGAFEGANSTKKQLLQRLNAMSSTCRSAKEYAEGSNQLLNRIGSFVVDKAFYGLEGTVTLNLGSYRLRIINTEARISDLENRIRYLDSLIAAAQAEGDES